MLKVDFYENHQLFLICFQSRHDIDLAKHVFPTITRIYGQPFHEQPESIIQPL